MLILLGKRSQKPEKNLIDKASGGVFQSAVAVQTGFILFRHISGVEQGGNG